MKKQNIIEMSIIVAIVGMLAFDFGCANSPQAPSSIAAEQALVTTAVEIGTQADLQSKPNDAPYFAAAEEVLNTVATGSNQVTAASIEAALAASGNASVNPLVNTAIAGGLNVADAYIQSNATNNVAASSTALKSAATWIATGIAEGLQASGK